MPGWPPRSRQAPWACTRSWSVSWPAATCARASRCWALLQSLPPVPLATEREVLYFIDTHGLMGRGIGTIDAHLLASSRLAGVSLWTRDKRLHAVAIELALAHVVTQH
jgi:predicted nucleic acid-binding protein